MIAQVIHAMPAFRRRAGDSTHRSMLKCIAADVPDGIGAAGAVSAALDRIAAIARLRRFGWKNPASRSDIMQQPACGRINIQSMLRRSAIGYGDVAAALLCGVMTGCASYRVPGMAADFHALGITPQEVEARTDSSIAARLDRQPLAGFPAQIAVVRVQGAGYRSHTTRGYGEGRFTVVTNRDVESDDAVDRMGALPMVAGVAPINRLVLPERLDSEESLRSAAANVQADMLLLYTFDTQFETDKKIAPLGLISLGLLPDRVARVTSTASAALVDTRNGYVYGVAEATGRDDQLTNAWNDREAVDSSRRKAESEAFDGLVGEFETLWNGVVQRYGPPVPVAGET
jgi:hypothetical protein